MNQPRMPSPAILVAVLALVAALAGTAVAGPDASTSKITKKKVTKIANQQIDQRAPGLSVAHANTADTATNAQNATNAADAALLGGRAPASFLSAARVKSGSVDPASIGGVIFSWPENNMVITTDFINTPLLNVCAQNETGGGSIHMSGPNAEVAGGSVCAGIPTGGASAALYTASRPGDPRTLVITCGLDTVGSPDLISCVGIDSQ